MKKKVVNIKEFLGDVLFSNGKFFRIDIPIRVMAVEDFAQFRKINNLWWRMQYAKLWFRWGRDHINCKEHPRMINNQKSRLTNMVEAFESGTFPEIPLTVGNDLALKDGSHRLSCHIYYNSKDIPIEILDTPFGKPTGINMAIMNLYSMEEWEHIIEYKNRLLKKYGLS